MAARKKREAKETDYDRQMKARKTAELKRTNEEIRHRYMHLLENSKKTKAEYDESCREIRKKIRMDKLFYKIYGQVQDTNEQFDDIECKHRQCVRKTVSQIASQRKEAQIKRSARTNEKIW